VAVGFLHAYADPAHERRVARALAALGVPVTAATDLCPEIREYERFATTVANAYLVPRVARYLGALATAAGAGFEVVLSHGGTAPARRAALEPARQLLSGPAAGVRAALDAANAIGYRAALTLDVGGTSTDCAFLDGNLPRRRGREIAGIPIQLPMIDVHTIGAGGGSIARVDSGGLLRVGPESAGADPGPACYGRGGPPTVTDALVVLGRIPGTALAGGTFPIDRALARRALETLARDLGHGDPVRAAEGVVRVAESHMSAALRLVSVERGHDPRRAVLVCFGGAGGLFACALAAELGAPVWFPRHAGVFSALGALTGGSRREHSRTVMLDARDRAARLRVLGELERAARRDLGAGPGRVTIERRAEVRARGQAHELSIEATGDVVAAFHAEHARRFGFANPNAAVEIVTLEVRASRPGTRLPAARAVGDAPRRTRAATAAVRHDGRSVTARVWSADETPRTLVGPALVIEDGATLWIAPGWGGRRLAGGLLLEQLGAER
jgi:N-methylhydantoinase A